MTKTGKWLIAGGMVFCLVLYILFFIIIFDYKKENKNINEKLLNSQSLNERCSQVRDSLFQANNELSKYKTLTQAMVRRDEVTGQLKYKVGALVYMKNDSAKVVIEDVLIGGGKYNYYVKYKVLLRDNTSREIVPELIY